MKIRKSNNDNNSENYEDEGIPQSIGTILRAKMGMMIDQPAEQDALDFQSYSQDLANIIREVYPPRFSIGIFGKWGTGKTTLMKMIERELGKEDNIPTIWFDAWRFEREVHSAFIPFLRTFGFSIEEYTRRLKSQGKLQEANYWETLKKSISTTLIAFLKSTKVSYRVKDIISIETDFEKLYNSFDQNSPPGSDVSLLYYDAIRYVQNAMDKLPDGHRVVVFVDDLDRCTPEKALEVLESIKSLFDIKGMIFVIGMNYDTINSLVTKKFPDDPRTNGFEYMIKLVQLSFQIPDWKPEDIFESLLKMISIGLEGSELVEEFLQPATRNLVARSIEPNPRQVKRFLNNIIVARMVYEYLDIDKLIAVQALNIRPKWNKFLELISENDTTRRSFFDYYYIPLREKGMSIYNKDALDNYIKEKSYEVPMSNKIIEIFQELIKPDNVALKSFLDDAGAAEILRDIESMENYRRALSSTRNL